MPRTLVYSNFNREPFSGHITIFLELIQENDQDNPKVENKVIIVEQKKNKMFLKFLSIMNYQALTTKPLHGFYTLNPPEVDVKSQIHLITGLKMYLSKRQSSLSELASLFTH